jgi:hypothetical protein
MPAIIKARTMMTAYPTSIGEKTIHQDQAMTSVSLRTMNTIVRVSRNPMM